MNREQILTAFDDVHREGNAYWARFPTKEFFSPLGEAWSPAENVRHLIKSSRPLVKAFSLPRIALLFMFGRTRRGSASFEDVRTRYLKRLDEGVKAGKFTPSKQSESNLEAWREKIMRDREFVHEGLLRAIRGWSETGLDSYQLPHPALGKLTLREMLYFSLYHERHHIAVVERRALRSSGSSAE